VYREQLLSRISIDPNVCFGKPCIRGHRIWVTLILDFLANGMTVKEILQEYPGLAREDVYACLAYGKKMARERYVENTDRGRGLRVKLDENPILRGLNFCAVIVGCVLRTVKGTTTCRNIAVLRRRAAPTFSPW